MTNSLQITTPSDLEIRMTRVFNAPRRLVFDCWTKPELLRRWLTGPDGWSFKVCEVDLRVGGAYRFVWGGPDGAVMGMGGVFLEIVSGERLVSKEKYDDDWTGGETQVTGLFTEHSGQTTVATTIRYSSKSARDGALSSGMAHGVAAGYDRLEDYLLSLG